MWGQVDLNHHLLFKSRRSLLELQPLVTWLPVSVVPFIATFATFFYYSTAIQF